MLALPARAQAYLRDLPLQASHSLSLVDFLLEVIL